jgi:phosphoribosylaminoimidazole-succinocarboxamide synthase
MEQALTETNFSFPGQTGVYKGKVRDVYTINNKLMVMVATDRISAFDVVLPRGIPFKGQLLNQLAAHFLDATADIVPNWKVSSPDPVVTIGKMCKPFAVEMIVRAYLSGSAWRTYKNGIRTICGVSVPDGLKEHQQLPHPLITPTTKSQEGHDADISREEILKQGLVDGEDYALMEKYSLLLFERGSLMASRQGLILVDTKYEFGKYGDDVILIDEIHTPDSSRYFYADGYQKNLDKDLPQKQLSKEFVREWLMANGFQGQEGQQVPEMTDEFVLSVSQRYMELFERITGKSFVKASQSAIHERIERNVNAYLSQLGM